MLKVKSFDLMDDKGMNELLTKFRLASGAHILVSEGKVCIPYEDGECENDSQRFIRIGEQKNLMLAELDILRHSLLVVESQIDDQKSEVAIAESVYKVATNDKESERQYNHKKALLSETEGLYARNKAEEKRLLKNIELFDKIIGK